MPEGDHTTARLHREWLKRVTVAIGLTPTSLAKRIGIAPSTLTRPLAEGEDGISTLHAATIAKIVDFAGVEPPKAAAAPERPLKALSEDASPFKPSIGDPVAELVRTLIADRDEIYPWTIKSRSLELVGFLPGDIVLVDQKATPKPGDAVCAQVYSWSKISAETVIRQFQRAAPIDILVARSLDPQFDQPLVVDGERVIVAGVLLPYRLR